ncbi:CRTAC1 family protein [Halobacteria archaeon AArc-curdl1]|uniref:CRTAC1 family protein n=1 Tax=Natronosalvus hydrolyticus TaxID=2979988 RepID=A0AAP2Z6X4_9EURY|nr:CRTAC1 family protein [Halobacteria archaeon AArc-curdl1]
MNRAVVLGLFVLLVVSAGFVVTGPFDFGGAGNDTPTETELSFTEVAADVGLEYESTERDAGNGNDGLYVADYTNNLREDILAIGDDEGDSPILFMNTGDGFERTNAIPDIDGRVQGALWLDHDNDGWEDLLLLRRGDTPVFLENEGGEFVERDVGFDDEFAVPVAATAADADGNGCLDVFVADYGDWTRTTPKAWTSAFFDEDNGNPNALYRGSCGTFERDDNAGIGPGQAGPHWSMAATFADLTGDGNPDIHVANDYYNDTVYLNRGDGTFTREYLGEETDRNGMSSTIGDVTADGQPEIFVTNIYFPRDRLDELDEQQRTLIGQFFDNRLGKRMQGNNLLAHRDDGFTDVGSDLGIAEGGWGWAVVLADLDSDGQLDAFHGTQDVVYFDRENPVYALPMVWVQHDGDFYRQDASATGIELTDDRGVVRMDYRIDGALDVAIATYDDRYRLYRNDADQGNSLQVVVGGAETLGHTTIGAEVTATVDETTQHRFHNARADYQSQDSRVLHVGTGDAESVDELRVVWPDGTERTLEDVETGQRILLTPDGIEATIEYEE